MERRVKSTKSQRKKSQLIEKKIKLQEQEQNRFQKISKGAKTKLNDVLKYTD
jgi:hypothetical protein